MEIINNSAGVILWLGFVLIISILLPIICLINILTSNFKNNDKLIWILVVVFFPFFGSLLYLFIGRKQRI